MSHCSSCNKIGNVLPCDSCKSGVCHQCSELSASEIRCMELKKRKLIFLCQGCEIEYKQVPVLIKKINEFEKQNGEIKDATGIDDMIKKIQEKILIDLTDTIEKIVKNEINGVKQEINDLKESNKDLVKLFTGAPSNVIIKPPPLFKDIVKKQAKVNSELLNNIPSKQQKQTNTYQQSTRKDYLNQSNPNHKKPSAQVIEQHITNMTNTISQSKHVQDQVEDEFQEVRRRPRKKNLQIGTSAILNEDKQENEFEGRANDTNKEKKIWLFISRAKSHVTEEIVKSYISKKLKRKRPIYQ